MEQAIVNIKTHNTYFGLFRAISSNELALAHKKETAPLGEGSGSLQLAAPGGKCL